MTYHDLFNTLKPLLAEFAGDLVVTDDSGDRYSLDTRHVMKNGKPLFFGAVVVNKSYVSVHLMPVYVFPGLLESLSPELRARMQGKSCFNFKRTDQVPVTELADLVSAGFQAYREAGYV